MFPYTRSDEAFANLMLELHDRLACHGFSLRHPDLVTKIIDFMDPIDDFMDPDQRGVISSPLDLNYMRENDELHWFLNEVLEIFARRENAQFRNDDQWKSLRDIIPHDA